MWPWLTATPPPASAKALGGQVLMPPTDIPDIGRFAVAVDPLGAAIAVIRMTG